MTFFLGDSSTELLFLKFFLKWNNFKRYTALGGPENEICTTELPEQPWKENGTQPPESREDVHTHGRRDRAGNFRNPRRPIPHLHEVGHGSAGCSHHWACRNSRNHAIYGENVFVYRMTKAAFPFNLAISTISPCPQMQGLHPKAMTVWLVPTKVCDCRNKI